MQLAHRTLAAALTATLILPACVVHGKYRALGYVGNGALAVAGGTIAIVGNTGCASRSPLTNACTDNGNELRTGTYVGGTLLVLGVVGLILQVYGHEPRTEVVAGGGPPGATVPTTSGDDVLSLSRRALGEARLGHCGSALDLAHDVFKIAPAYFENVLSRDPDMRACL
jgi:hypothetical protein